MSATANWSYANTATVKPFLHLDQWSGQKVFGPEYEIDCTWAATTEEASDAEGKTFVSKYEVFTEHPGIKHLDQIRLSGQEEWMTVRLVTEWDMSFFGESNDYKVVT